jgi:hypothetical protein
VSKASRPLVSQVTFAPRHPAISARASDSSDARVFSSKFRLGALFVALFFVARRRLPRLPRPCACSRRPA